MSGDLTSYLASRYLVAEPKASKKRKRKHHANGGDGLLITDDDAGWARGRDDDDDDDKGMAGHGATVAGTSAEFRRAKKNNWKALGEGEGEGKGDAEKTRTREKRKKDDEEAAADAIISQAAAETAAARAADDEAPVVAGGGGGSSTEAPVLMSDGTHAGLQSAATVVAQLERRRREERERYEAEQRQKRKDKPRDKNKKEDEEEVVYRDATGRRVDIAMRRQQVRQAAQEAEQKERDAQTALRGDVQREAARQRREQLEEAALLPVARRADDEDMNRELKAQTRWNDPMAPFLQEKQERLEKRARDEEKAGRGGGVPVARTRANRPTYKGAAAPNRYGIRPGYRWDGVDRSNGFEADRFKAINRRERNKGLEYAWQMDE